jgi:predicted nucleic acid-binding protein
MIVLLDSRPLGRLSYPRATPANDAITRWLDDLLAHGIQVLVPEVADYEVRRELMRTNSTQAIARLDALATTAGYLPLTTATMRQAAAFWAQARQRGRPTADPHALDGDVILAAQAVTLDAGGDTVVIATTNVGHLAQFADAREWQAIP